MLGTVFVFRQRTLAHPLIDLELFRVPAFSASVGTQLIATITFGGLYLLVSQYLQLVVGLSPLHAGLTLLPATVAGTLGDDRRAASREKNFGDLSNAIGDDSRCRRHAADRAHGFGIGRRAARRCLHRNEL